MENTENKNYTCEFQIFYLLCPNFKEKQSSILRNMLGSGRISNELRFSSFGNISFNDDDKQLRYPIFSELNSFTRSKTNCLIYDILETDKNPGVWDKCFIFMQGGHEPKYSYIMYNTKTGKKLHKFLIPLEDDALTISIQCVINNIQSCIRLEEYAHRLNNQESYEKYKKGLVSLTKNYEESVHACDRYNNRRY